MMISSFSNATIKQIRALRQRKTRAETGLCFVEGIRLVAEAVQLEAGIELLVVAPDLLSSDFGRQAVAAARQRGVRCIEVTPAVFESLSGKEGPQGLGAVVRQRWEPLSGLRPGADHLWVALHAPQDPGNIGAILRTCDAVGGTGLILLDEAADPYDPGAVRASMGALFALRLVRATFAEFAAWKAQGGCLLVGASGAAPQDYRSARYRLPLVLLMGSERQGLTAAQQAICDVMVSIPMCGRADSLNLAVATGVMLYEIFSQIRQC